MEKKILVQISNEREHDALMWYYDSLGYVWNGGTNATDQKAKLNSSVYNFMTNISFRNNFTRNCLESENTYTIPFLIFAQLKGIELPPDYVFVNISPLASAKVSKDSVVIYSRLIEEGISISKITITDIYKTMKSL